MAEPPSSGWFGVYLKMAEETTFFFLRSSREIKPEREVPKTLNSLKLARIKHAKRVFSPEWMAVASPKIFYFSFLSFFRKK
jgi:hypothetical protein